MELSFMGDINAMHRAILPCVSRAVSVQQAPIPPNPIQPLNISAIWIYDASIGVGITSGFESIMAAYMLEVHGLTVTVVNKSVSGQNLPTIAARFEAEKAAIAGRSDILIITMPIGNSIDGSWSTRTETYRNTLISQFNAFIDSIVANGNTVMPVNTTFRNYDLTTVNNEVDGSLTYNQNVVWGKTQSLSPAMWVGGKPYIDPYDIGRNWYNVILADPVHYTAPQGYHLLRSFYLDNAAARIKGQPPVRVARVENPTLSQTPPLLRSMVTFTGGGTLSKSTTVYWATQRGQSFVGSAPLLAMDGYSPNRMGITLAAAAEGSNTNSNAFNTGNRSKSLLNDGVKNALIQTTSLTMVEIAKFTGFAPGQTVQVQLLSCRSAAGATNRWAQFTLDGGVTYTDVNGAYAPAAIPTVVTITGVADVNGVLALGYRCRAGSTFAYLNGVIVTPM